MRQPSSVLFIAVDSLIPSRGRSIPGLDGFTATLDREGIPAVWLTSRSRLQFDEPRRKHGHSHPFIVEDGCAVCLPEGYFHLRPESSNEKQRKTSTIRLGRFTCIPIAERSPAAAEALETLSANLGVSVVTLCSLSPRELAQNTGLSQREAELAKQRDFDELFFFAGPTNNEIDRFLAEGSKRKLLFRRQGALWSAAIGASVQRCVREVSKLYDRALRYHARVVGVATADLASGLFPYCERALLLSRNESEGDSQFGNEKSRIRAVPLHSDDVWDRVLETLAIRV